MVGTEPKTHAATHSVLMDGRLVGIAGGIGSGKSSVAQHLASSLGCALVGFGQYVRTFAQAHGYREDRQSLQELGHKLVKNDLTGFCRGTLSQAKWTPGETLIVDGIRHLEVWTVLSDLAFPSRPFLVYLDAPQAVRQRRVRDQRGELVTLEHVERHATESQVRTALRRNADVVVDSAAGVEHVVHEALQRLQPLLNQ